MANAIFSQTVRDFMTDVFETSDLSQAEIFVLWALVYWVE